MNSTQRSFNPIAGFPNEVDPDFMLASIPVYGDLILSPMAGYSDLPYRSLCRQIGSALSYTEFINAQDVVHNDPGVEHKLAFLSHERPIVYQIFDDDPGRLLQAALLLQERHPDAIDINMGCSAKKVSGRGAGAGLLQTPHKVARIFRDLSQHLEIPVTAKIRLGWDQDSRNYLLISRIIEENGGAGIAVHGRTKSQAYSGQADWDAIAEIKASVSIPVIANGDVHNTADIKRIKHHTACDGVMVGRAAIGNPWIFNRLDRQQVSFDQVRTMIVSHLNRMLAFYGVHRGLLLFRKHAARYISPYRLTRQQRKYLLNAKSPSDFIHALDMVHVSGQ